MSKKLFKATSSVSSMTFLSRVLGMVRDILAAQIYGVNAQVDAFYVAFRIPNFMRNLFAEGSFSQAFVPVLADYKTKKSEAQTRHFVSYIAGALGSVLFLITLLGMLGAPWLIKLFAPGYSANPTQFQNAVVMLRTTFPYLMLISLTALASAVLNTYNRFAPAAFTPVLLNLCLIAAALWLSHYFAVPVEAQAWGVLIAGFIQLGFLLPFLRKIGFLVRPRLNWRDPGVKRVLKVMLPALFGASIGQLSLLINTIFASFLQTGSIAWLYNAERLAYFPLGVFGVALSTVVLPHLSAKHAEKSPLEFANTLDWGIRCNLLIGVPAAISMFILAGPLVSSLFYYGKFTEYDVTMTSKTVMAYSLGLLSFMLVKVLSSALYAQQKVKIAVKIGIIAIVCNIVLNGLLVIFLAHVGLALAASIASWINTLLLLGVLAKQNIYKLQRGWGLFCLRLFIANTILGLALWWLAADLRHWFDWNWQHRIVQLAFMMLAGILVYCASLWLSGMRSRDLQLKAAV
ncbi:MAG: murJ [Gammaproteobacteria bacterium]|jgi:putative peptidoglycan lipid II flippase|nr:murJ [Gammaproteobacteria bacterium]